MDAESFHLDHVFMLTMEEQTRLQLGLGLVLGLGLGLGFPFFPCRSIPASRIT